MVCEVGMNLTAARAATVCGLACQHFGMGDDFATYLAAVANLASNETYREYAYACMEKSEHGLGGGRARKTERTRRAKRRVHAECGCGWKPQDVPRHDPCRMFARLPFGALTCGVWCIPEVAYLLAKRWKREEEAGCGILPIVPVVNFLCPPPSFPVSLSH